MCPMTFCQWARRVLVIVFVALAVWQAAVATTFDDGHRALPHLIMALVFIVAMVVVMVFDWWWESRRDAG